MNKISEIAIDKNIRKSQQMKISQRFYGKSIQNNLNNIFMFQQNLSNKFQKSIDQFIKSNEEMIMNINDINNLIDQQMKLMESNKKIVEFIPQESSTNNFSQEKIIKYSDRNYFEDHEIQQNPFGNYIKEQNKNYEQQNSNYQKNKIPFYKLNENRQKNAMLKLLNQKGRIQDFFSTKFFDIYEFAKPSQSKIKKVEFRNVFVKWMIENKIFPSNMKELTSDDLMIIQRTLTFYIKQNLQDKCIIQAKYYSGFRLKRANHL